jgi:8-oxo-dGTP diphosphatase
MSPAPPPTSVVGAAIVRAGRVLAACRTEPPELAGLWEFPGGKVESGESDAEALRRECREELGVEVVVGARVGPDVAIAGGAAVIRVFHCTADVVDFTLSDHSEVRWLRADELDSLPWIPADLPIVAALRDLLRTSHAS